MDKIRRLPTADAGHLDNRISPRAELRSVLNPITNFKAMIFALRKLRHRAISLCLLLAFSLSSIVFYGEMSIIIFYLKSKPFYLRPRSVGFFLAYQSALVGIVGLVAFNWVLQKCFKLTDISISVLSITAAIFYQVLLGLSSSTSMLCGIQILQAICALNVPNIRSFISKMADPDLIGTTMGAVCLTETFSIFTTNMVIPFTYAGLLSLYRGAPFFLLAAIMFVTLIITSCCAYNFKKSIMKDQQFEEKK